MCRENFRQILFGREKSIKGSYPRLFILIMGIVSFSFVFFIPYQKALSQDNSACLTCHGEKDIEGEGGRKVFIDEAKFTSSVHGTNAVECTMCHQDLAGVTDFPHALKLAKVSCSACHENENTKYLLGVHGKARQGGKKDAPSCVDCHGSHYILARTLPESSLHPLNIPAICDRCHADAELAKRNGLPDPSFIMSYDLGIHGKGLRKSGLVGSATCVSCHKAHDILPKSDPDSSVNRKKIPYTCGTCHAGIFQQYIKSVHGLDFIKGIKDVPVCTDCHGEHAILGKDDPNSRVYATRVGATCSKCHDDSELIRKFGLPPDRLRSYEGTYHGIASRGGNTRVANCASCHGVHDILPSSNPESSINEKNLPATCGKPECHGSKLKNVVKGKVHIIEPREENVWAYIVSNVYKVLITVVIGSFVIFIIVDLYARFRRKRSNRG